MKLTRNSQKRGLTQRL